MDSIGEQDRSWVPKALRKNAIAKALSSGSTDDSTDPEDEFTIVDYVPERLQPHMIALVGEFVGTFLFLFFAFSGTQVVNVAVVAAEPSATIPDPSKLLYISLVFGFSLAVNAWVFYRVSGGLFNPAVTLGMYLIGAVPSFSRAAIIIFAQLAGGIAAAALVDALFPGALNVSTTLSHTSIVRGLFIEMFLTAELVFTIFMLAAEQHQATYIAPVGIGLSLFIAELTGVFYTGGSLNPARSFGPCVVTGSFPGYHWIYWVGPILGALVAVAFYKLISLLNAAMAIHSRRRKARAARAKAEQAVSRGQSGLVTSEKDTVPRSVNGAKHGNEMDLEAQVATGSGHVNGNGAGKTVMPRGPGHVRGVSEGTAGTSLSGETTKASGSPPITPGV